MLLTQYTILLAFLLIHQCSHPHHRESLWPICDAFAGPTRVCVPACSLYQAKFTTRRRPPGRSHGAPDVQPSNEDTCVSGQGVFRRRCFAVVRRQVPTRVHHAVQSMPSSPTARRPLSNGKMEESGSPHIVRESGVNCDRFFMQSTVSCWAGSCSVRPSGSVRGSPERPGW